jgi:oligopeptide transport system ATP-binding protein
MSAVLSVKELQTSFSTDGDPLRVVRSVSFDVEEGEAFGIVGESGCGKSVTALSIVRLLPAAARIVGGSVLLQGEDLLELDDHAMRRVRGGRIGIVFQDSMTSLNPLLTVGRQLTEGIQLHQGVSRRSSLRRAAELLEEVGVPDPAQRLRQYPHQLSGGLRQRVAVAIALAPNPTVLIADEPTTALDVTIQAQLLELLRREQRERRMALILITHDLGVVAGVADRVAVMYAGRIVEVGETSDVFARPAHPYTLGLLASAPRIDGKIMKRLPSIPGAPPPTGGSVQGCPFRPRCGYALADCEIADPPLHADGRTHAAACWADITGGQA